MEVRRALSLFLRSKTHLTLLGILAAAGLVSALAGFTPAGPVLAAVIYLAGASSLFFSRRGAEAIVARRGSDAEAEALERIEAARKLRDRISYLRLPDAEVSRAVEYALLVSGQFLEACAAGRRFVPRLSAELEDILAACADYLKSADAASSSKRYGVEGADDADGGRADFASAAAAFIRRSADQLSEIRESEFPRVAEGRDVETMRDIDET